MDTIQPRYFTEGIDPLTGLQGQHLFMKLLSDKAQTQQQCEIMILGIDNFKTINNLYTYSLGDRILKHFAEELQNILPKPAKLFRLDGDSFGVIYGGEPDQVCERMYYNIPKEPCKIDGFSISFTVSAGVCQCPAHGSDGDTLLANVNMALGQAKSGRKNCLRYYSQEMSERTKQEMLLMERLRYSVEHNFEGFSLCY